MIVASGKFRPISACLLAGFFLSQSFVSLHELVLYGDQFRYSVLDNSPNWFFIGSLGYALDGPLLYLYVVSIIRPNFRLNTRHWLHLLPLVIYFIFLFAAVSSEAAARRGMIMTVGNITYVVAHIVLQVNINCVVHET